MKVLFYYVTHTDNLEGHKEDYVYRVELNNETALDEVGKLNMDSDGETSHTPLYLTNLSGKVISKFN